MKNLIYTFITRISRKLNFLPRGKIGVFLNSIFGDLKNSPIKEFRANNGLIYFADLRSYTENYTPWTGEYEGKTLDKVLKYVPKIKMY